MIHSSNRWETLVLAESAVNRFEKELKKFKTSYKSHHKLIPKKETAHTRVKRLEGRVEVMHHGKLTLLDPIKHDLGERILEPNTEQEKEVYLLAKSLADCHVIERKQFDNDFVTSMLLRAVKHAIEERKKKGPSKDIEKIEEPLPEEIKWKDVPDIHDEGFIEAAKKHFLTTLLVTAKMDRMTESRIPLFKAGKHIGDIDIQSPSKVVDEVDIDEKEIGRMSKAMIKELKLSLGHPGKVSKKGKKWQAQFSEKLEELAILSLRESIQLRRSHNERNSSRGK